MVSEAEPAPMPINEVLAQLRELQRELDRHDLPANVTATLDHAIQNLGTLVTGGAAGPS